jgi:hypothetical protein
MAHVLGTRRPLTLSGLISPTPKSFIMSTGTHASIYSYICNISLSLNIHIHINIYVRITLCRGYVQGSDGTDGNVAVLPRLHHMAQRLQSPGSCVLHTCTHAHMHTCTHAHMQGIHHLHNVAQAFRLLQKDEGSKRRDRARCAHVTIPCKWRMHMYAES